MKSTEHEEQQVSPCPSCGSTAVYRYKEPIDRGTFVGELVPKLAPGRFSSAKMLPAIGASCGYLRFFADSDARAKLGTSNDWTQV